MGLMRKLGIAAGLAAVAVTGVVGFAATWPDTFEVKRSVAIKAPPEKIFPLIDELRTFNTWNPFLKADPSADLRYSGQARGKGAVHEWRGNSQVGAGRVEITESAPPSRVVMQLDMLRPMEASNRVVFSLAPSAGATEVTWAMSGRHSLIGKTVGLFLSMDKMVGGAFEKGLADLKALSEK